ncbi:aminodeoxychorismate lyase [Parahaliea mediterranea]|uniref:aminodeoxychorismate lyase n=1 Tax=Parahaliea mediterranea TaxID=651086 RepID=UPI000E2E5044|nr:aminodeoxychorismate lyase [Parahaliea mediterranea]
MTADPCWIDGELSSTLPLPDRGLAFGDGVFETLLLYNGGAVLLDFHEARLQAGLGRLALPASPTVLAEAVTRASRVAPTGYAALRVTVTRGGGPRGYAPPAQQTPRTIAQLTPLASDPGTWREPLKLGLSSVRLAKQRQLAGIKHLNRLEQVLASAECARQGWDEALMLDDDDHVISAIAGNLFVASRGRLVTPRLGASGVAGTRRRAVIERWAPAQDIAVTEAVLDVSAVQAADEVFICNSLQGIRPVAAFAGQRWSAFPLARALHDAACREPGMAGAQ